MRIVKVVLVALTLLLLGSFSVPSSRANERDKKSKVTISTPFEIPGGQVLPAGTYTFSLYDSDGSRHVVQIWSADGTHLFANVLAINNYRMTPEKSVILFSERSGDRPNAIKVWFFAGDKFGQEFVYPKHEVIELAKAGKEPVPAVTAETLPVPADRKTAQIIAVTPQATEEPVTEAIETTPPAPLVAENRAPESVTQTNELPKTASLIPLIALLGAGSIGVAFVLKLIAG